MNDPPSRWRVVPASASVKREWERLAARDPRAMARCLEHLETTPLTRRPKRVYPLKGRVNIGRWGFEVNAGDKVYYRVDEELHIVIVEHAGAHRG